MVNYKLPLALLATVFSIKATAPASNRSFGSFLFLADIAPEIEMSLPLKNTTQAPRHQKRENLHSPPHACILIIGDVIMFLECKVSLASFVLDGDLLCY